MDKKVIITILLGIFTLIFLGTTIFCAGSESSGVQAVALLTGGGTFIAGMCFLSACEEAFRE